MHLSYYSVLRKTLKWLKVSVKLCTLQCLCVQKTKHKQKIKYENFLHEEARSQISEIQNLNKSSSDEV